MVGIKNTICLDIEDNILLHIQTIKAIRCP